MRLIREKGHSTLRVVEFLVLLSKTTGNKVVKQHATTASRKA